MTFLNTQKQKIIMKLDESQLIVSMSSSMANFSDVVFSLGNEKLAEKITDVARDVAVFAQAKVDEAKKEMADAEANH
jgi:hypothetical protein